MGVKRRSLKKRAVSCLTVKPGGTIFLPSWLCYVNELEKNRPNEVELGLTF